MRTEGVLFTCCAFHVKGTTSFHTGLRGSFHLDHIKSKSVCHCSDEIMEITPLSSFWALTSMCQNGGGGLGARMNEQ